MPEPLLTLTSVLPDRDVIRIDDEDYELAIGEDLSLSQRKALNTAWRRMMDIENQTEVNKTEDTEYSNLTRKIVSMILPGLPREKLLTLPRSNQEAIVISFFGRANDPRQRAMIAMMVAAQTDNLTGLSPSENSNDSSEENQNDGSISQLES